MKTAQISRETLLQQLKILPPMPQTLMRVWQVIDNPASSASTLAQAIYADPSLVASLLKLANSAAYGRARAITTIPEATTLLGFGVIKKMCMATICQAGLLAQEPGERNFDRVLFWRHCVGTGLAAEALAEILNLKINDVAFSHGLLHDVGILALDRCLPQETHEIFRIQAEEDRPLLEVEREVLGLDHADIGATLARIWNFPQSLQEAIQYHAHPRLERGRDLEVLIHLACMLTDPQEYCHCGEPGELFEAARRFLALSDDQLNRARSIVSHRLVILAQAFEL